MNTMHSSRNSRRAFCECPARSGQLRVFRSVHQGSARKHPVMEPEQSIAPYLQIVSGPLSGRVYKIDREVMVIGRNPDCDLVLDPKSVSRRHAAIVHRSGEYVLKDIGSTRGTYVNGLRLTQPVVLKNGNILQVGEVQLSFTAQAVHIQDGEQDQSTVFASIDMTTPSDRFLPVVKPEVKLRAMNRISQAFGSTLVLSEILEKVLATLFEIFLRLSEDLCCSKTASGGPWLRRQSTREPGPSAI